MEIYPIKGCQRGTQTVVINPIIKYTVKKSTPDTWKNVGALESFSCGQCVVVVVLLAFHFPQILKIPHKYGFYLST
jgi:hypothetical protein